MIRKWKIYDLAVERVRIVCAATSEVEDTVVYTLQSKEAAVIAMECIVGVIKIKRDPRRS